MNFNQMLKQATEMKAKMEKAQNEFEETVFDFASCGGAIKLSMTGKGEIKSLHIQEDLIDPKDPDMLSDAIMVAINEASSEVKAKLEKIMSECAPVPGNFGF